MEEYVIIDGMRYTKSEEVTTMNGRPYTVRSYSPVFKDAEEEKARLDRARNELFNIFRKYMS